jgi:benzoyl-CoA reductase/2-hydroxyglutaryl-CoA dehydratase subunit BcrC/BadD/HgdB
VEIVFAAGLKPLDLNNIFINDQRPERLVTQAEDVGFPQTSCAWIKGIYGTIMHHRIEQIIAVTGGDCSNTVALTEVLENRGIKVYRFDYPFNRDRILLKAQMDQLASTLSAKPKDIQQQKSELKRIRRKLMALDRLTYQDQVITGLENHLFLVSSSDFRSDPSGFERDLDNLLRDAKKRRPETDIIRLGYVGVPPIMDRFYETIESHGARVVFNETQRQFSMPYDHKDLVQVYLNYTYPYDFFGRLKDIQRAVEERRLEGIIHYTQSFCHRQIYDLLFREHLSIPMLTIEGDKPGPLDSRTTVRLEAFIEMLKARK